MIINAINGNGNRLIRVNKDTNKDAVKEFLVTTLSQCDTNGHFIETPYSESKLLCFKVVINTSITRNCSFISLGVTNFNYNIRII